MNERQTGVLSGWKDIANYLGKAVRTVQRYEYDWDYQYIGRQENSADR